MTKKGVTLRHEGLSRKPARRRRSATDALQAGSQKGLFNIPRNVRIHSRSADYISSETLQATKRTWSTIERPTGYNGHLPAHRPPFGVSILGHLSLWPEQAEPACLSRAPPSTPPPDGVERIVEPYFDDLFPDYDTEPVYLSSEALA